MKIFSALRNALGEFVAIQPQCEQSIQEYVDTLKKVFDYIDNPEVNITLDDFAIRDGIWSAAKGIILGIDLLGRDPTEDECEFQESLRKFHRAYMIEFEADYH